MPGDSVKGFAGDDLDVVGSFFPRESEELIEKKRGSQDGGACVVGESLVTKNGGATPRLLESLEESDIVTTGLEASGRGETSKAGADDDGGGANGRDHRREGINESMPSKRRCIVRYCLVCVMGQGVV